MLHTRLNFRSIVCVLFIIDAIRRTIYRFAIAILQIDKNKRDFVWIVRITTYIYINACRLLSRLHYAYNARPCSILAMVRGVARKPLVGAIQNHLRYGTIDLGTMRLKLLMSSTNNFCRSFEMNIYRYYCHHHLHLLIEVILHY